MSHIHYREWGSGSPLVFLHGFCDSHELWSEFIKPFCNSYHVITPDLPGFGQSKSLKAPFSLDQVADSLAEWLKGLTQTPAVIVGHSLGGYVALSLLERHADLVAGVVLFHSTAYPDSPERKQVRNKVIAFVSEHGVSPFIETFVPGLFADKSSPAIPSTYLRVGGTKADSLIGYAEAMRDRPDRSDLLARTKLPVQIIGGVEDSLISIEDLRRLARQTPKTQLFELSGVGHMGMFEAEKKAQDILSRYMKSVWPV